MICSLARPPAPLTPHRIETFPADPPCALQAASVAVPLVSCYLTEAAAAATISRRAIDLPQPCATRQSHTLGPAVVAPFVPCNTECLLRRGAAPEWRSGTVWQTRMACAGATTWLLWRHGGEVSTHRVWVGRQEERTTSRIVASTRGRHSCGRGALPNAHGHISADVDHRTGCRCCSGRLWACTLSHWPRACSCGRAARGNRSGRGLASAPRLVQVCHRRSSLVHVKQNAFVHFGLLGDLQWGLLYATALRCSPCCCTAALILQRLHREDADGLSINLVQSHC